MPKSKYRKLGLSDRSFDDDDFYDEKEVKSGSSSSVVYRNFGGHIPALSAEARGVNESASNSFESKRQTSRVAVPKPVVSNPTTTVKPVFRSNKNERMINEYMGDFFDKLPRGHASVAAFEAEFEAAIQAYQKGSVDNFVKTRSRR